MTLLAPRGCEDLEAIGIDEVLLAKQAWQLIHEAELIVRGIFKFASGKEATIKVDGEKLNNQPQYLDTVLGFFALFPCVQNADVFLYVPDGMREPMNLLGERLNKPVAQVKKPKPQKNRYDFAFETPKDRKLAHSAENLLIGEDIVSTLGSVAAVRGLLLPEQNVHSIALLLRDSVNPDYQKGLVDHYLVKHYVPYDGEDFWESYNLEHNLIIGTRDSQNQT